MAEGIDSNLPLQISQPERLNPTVMLNDYARLIARRLEQLDICVKPDVNTRTKPTSDLDGCDSKRGVCRVGAKYRCFER